MNLRIKKKIRKNFFLLIKKIGPKERFKKFKKFKRLKLILKNPNNSKLVIKIFEIYFLLVQINLRIKL